MLKGRLTRAGDRLRADGEDHAAADVVGYRVHLAEEEEPTVAIDEVRTNEARLAIILGNDS